MRVGGPHYFAGITESQSRHLAHGFRIAKRGDNSADGMIAFAADHNIHLREDLYGLPVHIRGLNPSKEDFDVRHLFPNNPREFY